MDPTSSRWVPQNTREVSTRDVKTRLPANCGHTSPVVGNLTQLILGNKPLLPTHTRSHFKCCTRLDITEATNSRCNDLCVQLCRVQLSVRTQCHCLSKDVIPVSRSEKMSDKTVVQGPGFPGGRGSSPASDRVFRLSWRHLVHSGLCSVETILISSSTSQSAGERDSSSSNSVDHGTPSRSRNCSKIRREGLTCPLSI